VLKRLHVGRGGRAGALACGLWLAAATQAWAQAADAGAALADDAGPEVALATPAITDGGAPAPDAGQSEPGFVTQLHASYRLVGSEQTDVQLGRRDTGAAVDTLGHRLFPEHQLRIGARTAKGALELIFDADLLKGLVTTGGGDAVLASPVVPQGGAPGPLLADPLRNRAWGVNLSSLSIRQALLRWKTQAGLIGFGATTYNFGQGMLANGAGTPEEPGFDRDLGDQRFGDRVLRGSFTTRLPWLFGAGPDELTFVLAADLVLQDSTATLVRPFADWSKQGVFADRAVQGLLGVVYQRKEGQVALVISRRQTFFAETQPLDSLASVPFGTDLGVWVFDFAAGGRTKLEAGPELTGALDAVLVAGSTNHIRNDSCRGNGDTDRCRVLQGGAVARGALRSGIFTAELLGGYASGDSNPFDDQVSNFKFARDYQVGLVLFDQVLAWQSAAQVRRASDPLLTNSGPAGVELLSTNGAVTNAIFVQPTVKVQPLQDLELVGAVLWARAPTAYADAFWTSRTGVLTNAFGQPAGANYGFEFDLGANWKHRFDRFSVHAGLAGGLLLPGDAFVVDATGKKMDAVHRVKARCAVWF
jgi:hypothetical protein